MCTSSVLSQTCMNMCVQLAVSSISYQTPPTQELWVCGPKHDIRNFLVFSFKFVTIIQWQINLAFHFSSLLPLLTSFGPKVKPVVSSAVSTFCTNHLLHRTNYSGNMTKPTNPRAENLDDLLFDCIRGREQHPCVSDFRVKYLPMCLWKRHPSSRGMYERYFKIFGHGGLSLINIQWLTRDARTVLIVHLIK